MVNNNDNILPNPLTRRETPHNMNMTKDIVKMISPEPKPKTVHENIIKKAKHEKNTDGKSTDSGDISVKENVQNDEKKSMSDMSDFVKRTDEREIIGKSIANQCSGSNTLKNNHENFECKDLVDGKVKRQIFPKNN